MPSTSTTVSSDDADRRRWPGRRTRAARSSARPLGRRRASRACARRPSRRSSRAGMPCAVSQSGASAPSTTAAVEAAFASRARGRGAGDLRPERRVRCARCGGRRCGGAASPSALPGAQPGRRGRDGLTGARRRPGGWRRARPRRRSTQPPSGQVPDTAMSPPRLTRNPPGSVRGRAGAATRSAAYALARGAEVEQAPARHGQPARRVDGDGPPAGNRAPRPRWPRRWVHGGPARRRCRRRSRHDDGGARRWGRPDRR